MFYSIFYVCNKHSTNSSDSFSLSSVTDGRSDLSGAISGFSSSSFFTGGNSLSLFGRKPLIIFPFKPGFPPSVDDDDFYKIQ